MGFFPRLPRVGLKLRDRPLSAEIALADGFFSRLRGLMFAAPPPPGRGMLIVPCNGIHALGMRGRFEAVFLSKDFRVLRIVSPIRPWLGVSVCPGAHAVLEWSVGEAARFGVCEGMRLQWSRSREEGARPLDTEAAA
ncbi:MAG: DUF192 domain-containing protein [Candidatus Accumulibacter sp.]|jgi:uncharacterized membrane protein (UPF0127 family)|nr:DUF192 domain-containing protein [Accumulibacter sp.]